MTYQQKIAGRRLAVVVMRVAEQTPEAFRALVPALDTAIAELERGTVRIVGP